MSTTEKKSASQVSRPVEILFGLIMGICLVSVQSFSQAPEAEARLRARLDAFWNAMVASDYSLASTYVHPESREYFVSRLNKSPIEKWKIEKLEFNKDYTECETTILATKHIPIFAKSVDWPLFNHWVLSEGEWYLKLAWQKGQNPIAEFFREEQKRTSRPNIPEPVEVKKAPDITALQRLVPDPGNPTVVHSGEKNVFRYAYQNDSPNPIQVTSVHADCHCTGVKKEHPAVAPGGTGTIEITLDTFGLPQGMVEKEVSVRFNDLPYAITIYIRVQNLPNFVVEPASVDFGSLGISKPVEKTIRIANQSGKDVSILSASNSDSALEVRIPQIAMKAGEEIQVILKYTPKSPGEFIDVILLRTNLPAEPIVNVRIKGVVTP